VSTSSAPAASASAPVRAPFDPFAARSLPPRPWHRPALEAVRASLRAGKAPLVAACTGAGKSYWLSAVVEAALVVANPTEVMVVAAPRQRLVEQLRDELLKYLPAAAVAVFYGKAKTIGLASKVVVTTNASAPELAAALGGRPVRLLFIDEAHRSETDEMHAAVKALSPRWRVGLSATPFRSTPGESLSMFDTIAYRYSIADGVRDAALVPFAPFVWWNGEGDGDVEALTTAWMRAERGPGVVSAENIDDAEACAGRLRDSGLEALAVHSRLRPSEISARIAWVRAAPLAGPPRALVHVDLLSEGVDIPELSWLIQRRTQRSPIALVQELGRIVRMAPGKTSARVYDPHARLAKMGLSTPEAIGEAVAQAMDGNLEALGGRKRGKTPPVPVVLPPATAVSSVDAWAAALAHGLERSGLPVPRASVAMSGQITPAQIRQLRNADKIVRCLPEQARDTVRELLAPDVLPGLPAIAASNLIGSLRAVDVASLESRRAWALRAERERAEKVLAEALASGRLVVAPCRTCGSDRARPVAERPSAPLDSVFFACVACVPAPVRPGGWRAPELALPVLPDGAVAGLRAVAAVPSFDWSAVPASVPASSGASHA
jgi:hypothetical protein